LDKKAKLELENTRLMAERVEILKSIKKDYAEFEAHIILKVLRLQFLSSSLRMQKTNQIIEEY